MLQSLRTVTYRADNLDEARAWYEKLLGCAPVHASPFAVVFPLGESFLTLLRADMKGDPIAYWSVADADQAHRRLVEAGAVNRIEVSTSMGQARMGAVVDPFGNVLGVMSIPGAQDKKPLDERPSETAQGVALLRALAALDERDEVRGPDTLAELFIDPALRGGLRDPRTQSFVRGKMPGSCEYILARTKFFDGLVREALAANIPQIVFLGAGYDTRAVRFRHLIRDSVLIELDSAPTQERKRSLLPDSPARYAPINFNRDRLEDVLARAGYERVLQTLFIWEGVTPYLVQEAVESTLAFIRVCSAPGSTLAFDYTADAPDMMERYGVKESAAAIRASNADERVVFRIKEGAVGEFLDRQGFTMIEHLDTAEMEARYLTLRDGTLAGRAMAGMRLVRAVTRV